ncbi:MAG: Bug family tripartite tricarboxylate transporter substrate binding protein [Casimicrobium sp.]
MNMQFHLQRYIVALLAALISAGSVAQVPSNKTITIVVPYAAGGPLDTAARLLADKARLALATNVIVENKPGAGGSIGAASVAKATPDGTTLLMGAVATHAINPWLYRKMPYDPISDFAPVTLVARVPNVLVMNTMTAKRLKITSVSDLIAYAKVNPGKLNFASGGNGSAGHIAGELFKRSAGVDMLHVPFNGASPAQTALMSGECDLLFDNLAAAVTHVKSGKFTALGVTTKERVKLLPDVPSVSEIISDFQITTWFGIFAPTKTPNSTLTQIHGVFAEALKSSDLTERLSQMGSTSTTLSSAAFGEMVRQEHAYFGRLITAAKISIE